MDFFKNLSLMPIIAIIDDVVYNEEWKDIDGFVGKYQISSFGRVKSLSRKVSYINNKGGLVVSIKKSMILKQYKCEGYLKVDLYDNLKREKPFVHILTGRHFVDNPENKPEINHVFGVRTDNFYKHLEWNTSSENTNHAYWVLNCKRRGKDKQKRKSKYE